METDDMNLPRFPVQLPGELWLIIAEAIELGDRHCYAGYGLRPAAGYAELKALRLTSKSLSYMSYIMKTLFCDMYFMPTKRRLRRLSSAGDEFNSIAPFVEKVTFVPAPESLGTSTDTHKLEARYFHSASRLACQEYCLGNAVDFDTLDRGDEDFDSGPLPVSTYMQYMKDHIPTGEFSAMEARITSSWQSHHQKAVDSTNLWSDRQMLDVWARTLRALKNLQAIYISNPSQDVVENFDPGYRPYWAVEDYYRFAHPIGDRQVIGALDCLAESKVAVRHLEFSGLLGDSDDQATLLEWSSLRSWPGVDFSRLQSFHYNPSRQIASGTDDLQAQMFAQSAGDSLDAVLARAQNTLQDLNFNAIVARGSGLVWPSDAFFPLPHLKHFRYILGMAYPLNLAAWIRQAPSLETLDLEEVDPPRSVAKIKFKPVFDAIRDHPRGLRVRFGNMSAWAENEYPTWSGTSIDLGYHTDDWREVEEELKSAKPEDIWDEWYLKLYLSGRVEWNDHLRKVYEGE